MPRTSRFDRDRVAKLFGNKHKLIHKPADDHMYLKGTKSSLNPEELPEKIEQELSHKKEHESEELPIEEKKPENTIPFRSSNYITMEKSYHVKHQGHQIQKMNFRCYND